MKGKVRITRQAGNHSSLRQERVPKGRCFGRWPWLLLQKATVVRRPTTQAFSLTGEV